MRYSRMVWQTKGRKAGLHPIASILRSQRGKQCKRWRKTIRQITLISFWLLRSHYETCMTPNDTDDMRVGGTLLEEVDHFLYFDRETGRGVTEWKSDVDWQCVWQRSVAWRIFGKAKADEDTHLLLRHPSCVKQMPSEDFESALHTP